MRLRRLRLVPLLAVVLLTPSLPASASTAPNDPLFAMQWNLRQISAPEAWRYSTGKGAVIAVVDSGVDLGHPDLKGKLLRGYACHDETVQDTYGQGTFLAGVAAATTNNRVGVAGVAPAARVLPVGDLYAGSCPRQAWASSIVWAANRGADVIAVTWMAGTDGYVWQEAQRYYDDVKKAVDYAWRKGAVVVVPAGNQRAPLCAEPWRGTRVLCVGSTNRHRTLATASSFDAAMRADYLVAPAGEYVGSSGYWHVPCDEGIVSTWLRGAPGENVTQCEVKDGYSVTATNRIAAAHVAGVAALLVAKGFRNDRIVGCLTRHTDDLGVPGRDPVYGFGLVNAEKAVRHC